LQDLTVLPLSSLAPHIATNERRFTSLKLASHRLKFKQIMLAVSQQYIALRNKRVLWGFVFQTLNPQRRSI
jgi:hypothetical protein